MKYNNLCIVQARTGSTRLPNKVLLKVGKNSLLEYEIKRISQSKLIDKIVVATTTIKDDDIIEKLCKKIKVDCYRGSESDVLDRYYQCSLRFPQYKNIVRATGDCPLIDPDVIDRVINFFTKNNLEYASNIAKETFPDGMDVEIFRREVLDEAARKAKLTSQREHVTLYIRNTKKYKKGNFSSEYDFSHFRLTVDEVEDYEVVKFLIQKSKIGDGYLKYISLLTKNPEIMFKNSHILRNAGLLKSLKNDSQIINK
jgi:spore coat polysaccharide biosynthesis protein SpsF